MGSGKPTDALVDLPRSGLSVRLQAPDDDRFHDAIELLTTADSATGVPADGDLREGFDGLPAEYAALEQEDLHDAGSRPLSAGLGRLSPGTHSHASAPTNTARSNGPRSAPA